MRHRKKKKTTTQRSAGRNEEAMRQMKPERPRKDRVTTEMLKLAKSRILPQLTAILNQCLRNGEVPAEYGAIKNNPAVQEGRSPRLEELQPISLLPTIYKKAFDSVESNAFGMRPSGKASIRRLLKLLRNIYSQATSKIQVGRAQVQIEIQRGVRQGDTQPEASSTALERNLQGAEMGRPRPEHQRKKDLQSALRRRHRPDRGQEEELQLMVTELQEASRRSGLKIKPTEDQGDGAEEINILLDGEAIQQVTSFVYLGQAIQVRRDPCKKSVAGSAADGTPSGSMARS
ncbi:hypothetical protein L596_026280 [Steinernema carpocapsae]|uniref:Reverse transcriptase domain-containing protein n=1 Tax=Steinernema carpocapsae TaxID=34508 RepID=A0A4U5M0V4_STECR|nr:hypothetical protein L596_026280 [Steinernema carpocapsae]